ncbi:MAG: hypothetical protein H6636_02115 [Anaerolineales bacterium]|nr:hypothetical protein [Anaerolineales bacterium]
MNTNDLTISEELFERFCTENKVPFSSHSLLHRQRNSKTPDYEIIVNSKRVILEVKQLDPVSPDDKEHQRQLDEMGITEVYEGKVAQRIRRKISDAMPQLNKWTNKDIPGLIFIYSNLPLDGRYIEPHHILEGMYGEEIFQIVFPDNPSAPPYVANVQFGGKRKVAPDYNTTLSAIVSIFEDWEQHQLHAYFYHNIFSKCKFEPDWLRGKRVKHFSLPNTNMKQFSEWVEI